MSPNTPKFIIVSANYHDITRLLPLMIVKIGPYRLLTKEIIIDKGNIMINRQNRLIAHPYYSPFSVNSFILSSSLVIIILTTSEL